MKFSHPFLAMASLVSLCVAARRGIWHQSKLKQAKEQRVKHACIISTSLAFGKGEGNSLTSIIARRLIAKLGRHEAGTMHGMAAGKYRGQLPA